MFNLKGPQGQNLRTTCGPRTTVWETLAYRISDCLFYPCVTLKKATGIFAEIL